MNFGPMNRDGGERRLNVAITRARREVIVFSTLRAEHIDLSKTRSKGVADLKCFLDYAERGAVAIAERRSTESGEECESPFEIECLRCPAGQVAGKYSGRPWLDYSSGLVHRLVGTAGRGVGADRNGY